MRKNICLAFTLSLAFSLVSAQEPTKEYVQRTFESITLINTQSTELTPAKGFEFNIEHRFGLVDLSYKPMYYFAGMDLTSNIRFGFAFSVGNRVSIGFGRTKTDKQYDFDIKYLAFRQTTDEVMPFTLALYFNAAIRSEDFPPVPEDAYFDDYETPFEYTFNHRLSYNTQILISRKFTRWFSAQISPTFIYRNLVEPEEENLTIALPVSLRFKVGFMTSVLAEYSPMIKKPVDDFIPPLSLAFEIRPVGHVFQVVISNSNQILNQSLYQYSPVDITEGKFYLGFNLHRNLYYTRRRK